MSLRGKSFNSGFVHSVKVPRLYKTASLIVKRVVENGESLKQLVYSSRHKNIKGVYALVTETIKHSHTLDILINKSRLLKIENRLDPWLTRILLTQMVIRGKELKGQSKPILTLLSYKEKLMGYLETKEYRKTNAEVIKPRYVRVNTLKHTTDEVIKIFRDNGWILLKSSEDYTAFLEVVSHMKQNEFIKDFHVKELLVFPPTAQFYKNELYLNGGIVLQDKASCLPVNLLHPSSSSIVLDMCSAPGMKTTYLSAKMRNKGTIYAVERNASRYNTLCKFVENLGCKNVRSINMDSLLIGQMVSGDPHVDTAWYKDVEYILVDPSCSGTGMVERKNIFSNEKKDSGRIKKLSGFQFKMLLHALTGFPNVKRVVYSTCSILPDENEKVVQDVLRRLNELNSTESTDDNIKVTHKFNLIEVMKDTWPRRGSDAFEIGKYCLYADPNQDQTNGFFIAVFDRVYDEDHNFEQT